MNNVWVLAGTDTWHATWRDPEGHPRHVARCGQTDITTTGHISVRWRAEQDEQPEQPRHRVCRKCARAVAKMVAAGEGAP